MGAVGVCKEPAVGHLSTNPVSSGCFTCLEGRVQPSPISASPLHPFPWSSGAQGRETHLNVRCRQSDSGRECHCPQCIRVQPSAAQLCACVWGTRRIRRWASGLQAPSRLLHPALQPCDLRTLLAVIGPNEAWAELERGEEVGEEADQFQTNYPATFSSCPGLGGLSTCDGGPGLVMIKARWHVNPHQPVLDSQMLPSRPHTPAPPPHKDPLPQAPVIYTSHLHQRGAPCSQRPNCRVSGGLSRSPGSARGLGSAALALRSLGASPLFGAAHSVLGVLEASFHSGGKCPTSIPAHPSLPLCQPEQVPNRDSPITTSAPQREAHGHRDFVWADDWPPPLQSCPFCAEVFFPNTNPVMSLPCSLPPVDLRVKSTLCESAHMDHFSSTSLGSLGSESSQISHPRVRPHQLASGLLLLPGT